MKPLAAQASPQPNAVIGGKAAQLSNQMLGTAQESMRPDLQSSQVNRNDILAANQRDRLSRDLTAMHGP